MILHSKVLGEGSPIIFLHTGLQTGETDFSFQQNYFKGQYKIVVVDLRGHGKSRVDQLDIHKYFDEAAIDVWETMNDLGLGKAHIVGCSLGGLVGLRFAKMFPDRLISLTLSGITPEKPSNWEEMRQLDVRMQKAVLENKEAGIYFDSIHESDWREFLKQSMVEDWYPFNETRDVSTLSCPTLFIVGEEKKHEVVGAIQYPIQNEQIHVAIVPFAGHLVHSEQPEVYTSHLNLFIRKVEESSL
ncbi:alpha/beta hydrolase [Sporosarcina oncorhynchi]|uniref:Alpha/beta hydrolase n=1 Tax=Sporosarcina oncorhynchi TaxID=3056444 RepID=A0ABZ0L1J1_9BACL|nr:alpha/beta hydrolase [Sporosarcina sp. T2O-4]WOV86325.1 alpha/beta hydrolase [Sporosarcina sp. T2O-4]